MSTIPVREGSDRRTYLVAQLRSGRWNLTAYERDDSMVALLKKLRADHPKLQDLGPRAQDVEKVLNSCGAILDALLPVRNRASVAHPNRELLGEPEARLVINTGRTILHYLDAKLS